MTRGRRPLIDPMRSLHIHIDGALALAIDARLWSEAENRVPKGAYQLFITEACVRMMRQQPLDLSPFAGSLPSEHVVYAFPPTRLVLIDLLKRLAPGVKPLDEEELFVADTLKIIKDEL